MNRRLYGIFHMIVHLVLALILAYVFSQGVSGYLVAIFATGVPDLDHIPMVMKTGIRKFIKLRQGKEFGKPRKYPVHNLPAIIATFVVGTWQLLVGNIFYAIGVYAAFLHFTWDFFEDVVIFRTGFKHWL